MKIGLSSLYLINTGFKGLEKVIEKSHVNYWEIVDEDLVKLNVRRVNVLKELKASFNLEYSVHAPFADTNIASFNPAVKRLVLKQLEKSLDYADLLGSQLWVLHPGMRTGLAALHPGEDVKINLHSIRYLAKKAENLGISIAVENMPEPFPWLLKKVAEFEQLFQELSEGNVGIALDLGHANTAGQISAFFEGLSDQIIHIHVSDNDGTFDYHQPIGKGNIDWGKVVETLVKKRFKGFVIVETIDDPLSDLKKLSELTRGREVQFSLNPQQPEHFGKFSSPA